MRNQTIQKPKQMCGAHGS